MQVNVVHAANPAAFDYLLYPEQHASNLDYLKNKLTGFTHTLTEAGQRFVEQTKSLYDQVVQTAASGFHRLIHAHATGIFSPDSIVPLETLEYIQAAPQRMQRFIMAEPTLREYRREQRIDGYSTTYIDVHPTTSGEDHYDWRRVNNGMLQEVVENGQANWKIQTFFEELYEGDRELDFMEQSYITAVWKLARKYLLAGQDPTNPYGGDVG